MWHENPAIDMYVENNYIVPSTETAVGMRKTLPALAKLALKLARKEKIGTAHAEDTCLPATAIMNIPISPAQNASWICSWRGCITRSLRQRCPQEL